MQLQSENCFFERDPNVALARRAMVEGLGTLLLVLAVAGSGLTARALFHETSLLALVANAITTAGALVGLIVSLGGASGGHFNPLISGLQWLAGERRLDCALAYIAAQLMGGVAGALLANLIFGMQQSIATPHSGMWRLAVSEVVATVALMIVVFGCARSGRSETGPFAVGAWLTAAIIATPSASFANPAIAVGALFAAGPMALPAATVSIYLMAHVGGALLALLVITVAYPRRRGGAPPTRAESSQCQATGGAVAVSGNTA